MYAFSTFNTRRSGALLLHVSIYLIIVECVGSTSSTAGIKFIASTFRYHVEDKSTVTTLLARQRSYTRSAEIIFVPTDALSPELTKLLARQCSYMHSAEIIFIPTDALSPELTTLLAQQRSYTRSETISVPPDALSILTDASRTAPSPDMLRGLAISTQSFTPVLATRSGAAPSNPMLATRSGAAPRIGIHSSSVGNMLESCAFQTDASNMLGGYAYMLALAFTLFVPGVSNTLGGCALCY
jgi:hypothetical protein